MGLCVPIRKELDGAVFGSYFIRTQPFTETIFPDYLALFVNSLAGRTQVQQMQTGGVQTNLTIPVIESLKIAFPNLDEQKQLASGVENSRYAHHEAKRLLESAKRAVEIAIEENEDAALQFLDEAREDRVLDAGN